MTPLSVEKNLKSDWNFSVLDIISSFTATCNILADLSPNNTPIVSG
jgi:hypothetical protein